LGFAIERLVEYSAREVSMPGADKRKQSLYFPEDMLREIQQEAARLDRSLSWVIQQGWKRARGKLKEYPSSTDEAGSLPDPREE
jgi:uncharacterized small protein (TIGR04563 family)